MPGLEPGAADRSPRALPSGRRQGQSQSRVRGENVGVTQVGDRVWLVSFMQYDLGYFDDEAIPVEPIENPVGPTVLPMRSE